MDQSALPYIHRIKKHLLIIVSIVIILLIAGGIFVYAQLFSPTCFTADDYKKFYGDTPMADESFGPGKAFYTASYEFAPDTATLVADDEETSDTTIETSFYKSNPRKQILYVINAQYDLAVNNKALATKRTDLIKSRLVQAGIPQSIITVSITSIPQQDTDDGDVPDDNMLYAADFVLLTLTSDSKCRE